MTESHNGVRLAAPVRARSNAGLQAGADWSAQSSGIDAQLVSVVILNYNYGRYLRECIDSVLAQDYAPIEVIVVDDGSTDDSGAVLAGYSGRVACAFKENGGMVSSMNHGFRLTRGAVVIFLDADDYLLPGAVSAHVRALAEPDVVRSQTYMTLLDDTRASEGRIPDLPAGEGDLRELVLQRGPGAYVSPPNSGNAWSRGFLDRVFPLPERLRTIGSETFLMDAAPLFGKIKTLSHEPKAAYRRHGGSQGGKKAAMTPDNIRKILAQYEVRTAWLEQIATSLGHTPRTTQWQAANWRLLTLNYLSGRVAGAKELPSLVTHLRPAFAVRGNAATRACLALILLGVRLAPVNIALLLAGMVIKLRYM